MFRNLSCSLRKIKYSILISSLLISLIAPFIKGAVEAQSAIGDQTIFLPLVSKNNQGSQEWLDTFNQYRKAAGLNPVKSNESMSYGLSLHTKYLLLNPDQKDWHTEYPGEPGYTLEGEFAASQSNMLWSNSPTYTDKQSIDLWMKTDRHRYHMLNPDLVESGFSLACDGINCYAGLNVLGGRTVKSDLRAVFYPGINQTDIPPIKFPISVGFYPSSDLINAITISKFRLFDNNGVEVSGARSTILDYVKEVVFIPSNDLLPNHRYRVDVIVSAGGKTFSQEWYFTTGSK